MIPFSVLDLSPIAVGLLARRRPAPLARPRTARRAPGLRAFLARRAPQHDRHRQRGDLRGHRLRRRRHQDHPRRLRRHHVAEPLAAGHRRAVRHAGHALPRPHRPRPRPRAGHRSVDLPGAAARPGDRGSFPAGCAGIARFLGAGRAGAEDPGCPGRRHARAGVATRGPASSARSSRPRSACRLPSRRTSRRPTCSTRWRSTAKSSSLPNI